MKIGLQIQKRKTRDKPPVTRHSNPNSLVARLAELHSRHQSIAAPFCSASSMLRRLRTAPTR